MGPDMKILSKGIIETLSDQIAKLESLEATGVARARSGCLLRRRYILKRYARPITTRRLLESGAHRNADKPVHNQKIKRILSFLSFLRVCWQHPKAAAEGWRPR
jgi:hypothetical protein